MKTKKTPPVKQSIINYESLELSKYYRFSRFRLKVQLHPENGPCLCISTEGKEFMIRLDCEMFENKQFNFEISKSIFNK